MSSVNSSADKNIVDRSRARRNPEMARAVKATRDRLQTDGKRSAHYDRELMAMYISSAVQGAAAMPVFVLLTAAVSILFFPGQNVFTWVVATLLGYALMAYIAKRASRRKLTFEAAERLEMQFTTVHAVTGLGWAIFAFQPCALCIGMDFAFFKGIVLLVAMAVTAMSSFTLRRLPLLAFSTPIMVFYLAGSPPSSPFQISMLAMLIATLVFFMFVSGRLYSANVIMLSVQAEKDWLIAELEMANSTSDEARRRAEEANLAKSRFLASMSHELRTPLNAILGFSEVMKNEVLGPLENDTYREYVSDIYRSGDHLLHLINEILDLSRIEAGRYALNEEPVSMRNIAEDCIAMVGLKAQKKDIVITAQFERVLPLVWADERSMRQVILNLLSNAVKFTPSNGTIILKVGWTAGGGQYVSVKDDGPGIPEDEIPVVLSAFGQGSIAIKSAEQGTGLGLPIVQAILAEHGGEFVLKSKLREGTEATIVLPRNRVLIDTPSIETPDSVKQKRRSFA
ncbi:MAG: HAMP domain-containing histidine kinase [Hyphomicrobiales bacterium]|nr:HAMP domain-containing histidine kinase [Hyphomicrobiales bacterium]MCP4998215.1 HAMP domain-containing histidine kinase [Hyphomicrobiales bacterium]